MINYNNLYIAYLQNVTTNFEILSVDFYRLYYRFYDYDLLF